MSKPYPALCADCKHSEPEENSSWSLRCTHPKVNGNDPWALASAKKARGTDCRGERERRSFLAVCGIKGKAWEPKPLAVAIDAANGASAMEQCCLLAAAVELAEPTK